MSEWRSRQFRPGDLVRRCGYFFDGPPVERGKDDIVALFDAVAVEGGKHVVRVVPWTSTGVVIEAPDYASRATFLVGNLLLYDDVRVWRHVEHE